MSEKHKSPVFWIGIAVPAAVIGLIAGANGSPILGAIGGFCWGLMWSAFWDYANV